MRLTLFGSRTFRQLLLRAAIAVAGVALSCGTGYSAEDVSLDFHEKDGHINAEGSFQVEAGRKTAWDVLTDYSHIPDFVHNMKVSRVQIREGNDVLLQQEAEGGFLFITQRVRLLLHIKETPDKAIVFKDLAHKEFKSYEGSWRIKPDADGKHLKITYRLEADMNFSAPAFLADDAMGGGARDLLKSVRKEILTRQLAKIKSNTENLQVTQQPLTIKEQ